MCPFYTLSTCPSKGLCTALVIMMMFCVCMNDSVHLLYISIYFWLWRSYLCWALILLFYHLHYYGGCQYVKGTKQILIAVCVVEFSGFHSNFLVVNYSLILLFCSVNVFTVFLYFLQNYSGNHSCQNYFVKTTEFFLQCSLQCHMILQKSF